MPSSEPSGDDTDTGWSASLPRAYFVGGHRVIHLRDAVGHSSWSCDCSEFIHAPQWGGEHWCQHTERMAAAAELAWLLRTPGLILRASCY